MCGIAGLIAPPSPTHPLSEALDAELHRFTEALRHRGPDDSGYMRTERAGLAHTRLAILDPTPTGAQPMRSPDGRYVLVFNGEVYNFAALREELAKKGERFLGRSDTEVVLRFLVREGTAALARFDGMFALALLDTRTDTVLLARDRAGQKPLFVAQVDGGGFAFSSEIEPLLRVPGVDLRLDPRGLSHLLSFGYVPDPYALRQSIRQVERGAWLRLRSAQAPDGNRYVEDWGPREPVLDGSDEDLCGALESVLSDTVREHLVSDVPVGVMLSGGVDSSLVAALAARHTGRLQTFSVVHREREYDERDAARAVANVIGSDHHEIDFSEAPLSEDDLDLLVDHHGDPLADYSNLAMLRIAREMRRHVTVALSGDGGDEVFAGYPRFGQLRAISALARLPRPLLRAGSAGIAGLRGARGRAAARVLRIADMTRARRAAAFWIWFWPEEQERLLRPEWLPPSPGGELDALLGERGALLERDPVASAHWLEQRVLLPGIMLQKVDRMSMAASLEVRPPLLGNRVTEFAARLPFRAKHRGATGKRILRTLARRLVPPWVVDRPKRGFALPLERHGSKVFAEASRFALESHESPLREIFRPEALDSLSTSLTRQGEGLDAEDSPFRRVHRRWLLTLLARTLVRHGGP